MVQELAEDFIPNHILFRSKEKKRIEEMFENFRKYNTGNNILIFGHSGGGKTTLIKKILQKKENEEIVKYASGNDGKTTLNILRILAKSNKGISYDLLADLKTELKEKPKIIVIDEADKIRDIKELFTDLNHLCRETKSIIIIITNQLKITKEIPEDARLTLVFKKIIFPPYNASEINKILSYRLNLIKNIPKVPEGITSFISAIAVREGSSVRIALNLLLNCLISRKFTQKFVNELVVSFEGNDIEEYILEIATDSTKKKLLKIIIELTESEKGNIKTSLIHDRMKNLTSTRVCQILKEFEENGIIESEYENLGKKGRIRIIKFKMQGIEQKIENVLCSSMQ